MPNKYNFWNRIVLYFISPIDNALATPVNNFEFFYDLKSYQPYPGPDAKDPYPNINDSSNAAFIKGGVAALGVISLISALIIGFYKQLRKKEAVSHYFFFEKLPDIKEWLKKSASENEDSTEVLLATAYYYNPDLSTFVLRWRRFWAFLTRSEDYLELRKYLRKNSAHGEKIEASLIEICKKINQYLALYINGKNYGQWIVEELDGKLIIRPEKNNELALHLLRKFKNELSLRQSKIEENKTKDQKVWSFIEARINELGTASYFYWIAVFIFYLLAGIGVIGSVVWPPIFISGIVLGSLWITKIIQYQTKQQLNSHDAIHNKDDAILFLEAIKHHIQLGSLPQGEINFANSKLCKEIEKTLQKKQNMSFVWPIFNGFIAGFFTISFSSWLLFAALGLVVTLNPVGTLIVAAVTVVLGMAYGIYSARKNYSSNASVFKDRTGQLSWLKENNAKIPDISLQEYDRLFRRGKTDKIAWTYTKQVFKRAWVSLTQIGTGILFLKLISFGVTTAIIGALGITAISSFLPLAGILLLNGLIFAGWHVYQYQLESKESQLDNIMKSLSHLFLIRKCPQEIADDENNSRRKDPSEHSHTTEKEQNYRRLRLFANRLELENSELALKPNQELKMKR